LVKLLALVPGHRLHRDQAIEVLWPESGFDTAINNLHQTIYKARCVLAPAGKDCLFLENDFLCLSGGHERSLTIDIEQFEAAALHARGSKMSVEYQAALALYSGDLLPDDLYADWASTRREPLRQVYLALMLELAQLYESQAEYDPAIEMLLRLLSIEKSHEEAHTGLMRLYALIGQRQKALRQYQALCEVLHTELEVEPGPGANHLYEEIQSGRLITKTVNQVPPGQPEKAHKPRHNLPHRLTTFIGREKEIGQVISLLRSARLLTVTGSGGVGKTSLALRAADDLVETFPNGVWQVELARLADPELLPVICAQTLGVLEKPGVPIMTALIKYLETKQVLLILDNCEHIIAACTQLADKLLMRCPKLTILATSREILNLTGETTFRVLSLPVPDPYCQLSLDKPEQSEAVRLFADRATQALPGFSLTQANVHAIVRICQRLDGIPLAIELAAARLRLLSIGQIELHLDDVFRLLTGGSRTALPRHRTLQALIGWSYNLLSEKERWLFARLSVFAEEWSLEAAEDVCADPIGEGLSFEEILDLLGQLADKSLIQIIPAVNGEMRYRMLETVRQYAHARLEEAGEAEAMRARCLAYSLRTAEVLEPSLHWQEQKETLEYLDGELDSLRVALK
jgi:predicted ATPase/DNA-binding SARP family transcriptional activator